MRVYRLAFASCRFTRRQCYMCIENVLSWRKKCIPKHYRWDLVPMFQNQNYIMLFSVKQNFDSGKRDIISFITNKPRTSLCIWQRCGFHMWQTVTESVAVTTVALNKSSCAFSGLLLPLTPHQVRLALWISTPFDLLIGVVTLHYIPCDALS